MKTDLILVGGGLANGLIAARLRQLRPQLRILLLERDATLGGNHTWSFHGTDVSPAQLDWLTPFIEQSWPHYEVHFPGRARQLNGSYHSVFAERFNAVIRERLRPDEIVTGCEVTVLSPEHVELADGRRFEAPAVIDGRGDPGGSALDVRFQKFVGQLVELETPVSMTGPMLMDATIDQEDGFRFMYTLPLTGDRLLIEDTRYSDTPALARVTMRSAIAAYARERGWRIRRILREEEGALPVVLGGDLGAFLAERPDIPRSGIRAGLFHYTTGYSLPEAVRLADDLAAQAELRSARLAPWIVARSKSLWQRGGYFRMLNRMLFLAGPPEERYRVLEHFYRLPDDLVSRFYAGTPTWGDRLRILSGKPPVPVWPALASLLGRRTEPQS